MFFKKGAVILSLLAIAFGARADDKKLCLIFDGGSTERLAVDLDQYNRIKFGQEAMTLSNPDNPASSLKLLYSAYNQFKIGESIPSSGIRDVEASEINLCYNSSEQSLSLKGTATGAYLVGVFNVCGVLVYSSTISVGESLSLQALGSGAYVAVAIGEISKHSIKFVKQ